MKLFIRLRFYVSFFLVLSAGVSYAAQLDIEVVKPPEPPQLLVLKPQAASPFDNQEKILKELYDLFLFDLTFADAFQVIEENPQAAYIRRRDQEDNVVNYAEWRRFKSQNKPLDYLVKPVYVPRDKGNFELDLLVYNILEGQRVIGTAFGKNPPLVLTNLRRAGHRATAEVIRTLTKNAVTPITESRILFVNYIPSRKTKELYLMDYDGWQNSIVRVTTFNSTTIFPDWSPDGTEIAYVSFKNNWPDAYIHHLTSGRVITLARFVGTNHTPRWFPDGKKLAISLSEAMAKYPNIFNRLYVNMVKAGEIGGALEQILDRLALFQEKAQMVRSKVKGAMWYPAVVISIAMSVVSIILIYVVPNFASMFEGLGAELPGPTQKLIDASNFLVNYWYIPLASVIGIIILFKIINTTSQGRYVVDKTKLRLPIFGSIIQKSAVSRFTRTFGTLLDTGVPILQTLIIVKDTAGNEVISRAMIDIHASIREGDTVSEPMKQFSVFPPLVVHMIAVGEETGQLDKMLIKVAEAYEREVDDAVDGMAKLIEPLLIVMLGAIIGTVVVALYLPIFNISQVMGKA